MAQSKFIGTFIPEQGSIKNEHISNVTADAIDADKMQHIYKPGTNFGFVIGGTPTTREEIVFVATNAGTVRGFHALLNVDGTTTSITFDLKKNGTTMLSGVVTITDATGNRVVLDGTLSVTTFAADDVISIAMTMATNTGAQGPYSWADIEENLAP